MRQPQLARPTHGLKFGEENTGQTSNRGETQNRRRRNRRQAQNRGQTQNRRRRNRDIASRRVIFIRGTTVTQYGTAWNWDAPRAQ